MESLFSARVAACHGAMFDVRDESGCAHRVTLAGRLRGQDQVPVTGDHVIVRGSVICELAPRHSVLVRKAAGSSSEAQVICANLDLAAIVTSPDDLNVRRVERYLAAIAAGGARPLLVLNKIDLAEDPAALVDELARTGAEVAGVSALALDLHALTKHLTPGVTVALIGSSGVGKSTLLNALLGHAAQATEVVRAHDARGQHTTTRRELFALPGGAFLIDTPGMRELLPWADEDALDATFADVAALAADCHFRDCAHEGEPGCAVATAVADGVLAPDRLAAFHKLGREQAYEARRRDAAAMAAEKRKWKLRSRALRRRVDS